MMEHPRVRNAVPRCMREELQLAAPVAKIRGYVAAVLIFVVSPELLDWSMMAANWVSAESSASLTQKRPSAEIARGAPHLRIPALNVTGHSWQAQGRLP
jgi:hypothetical protein